MNSMLQLSKYWISFGTTESGDNLCHIMYDHSPTKEEVDIAYRNIYPQEYEEVGHVYAYVTQLFTFNGSA